MIDPETEEEASLYVLGLLPPDEARRFESAMGAEPELARLVAKLETGVAAFGAAAPPRDPPAAVRERIMEQVRRTEAGPRVIPFPRRMAWLPWAAAACLALIAGRLAYDRYHLHLLVDSFVIRDHAQQRQVDDAEARVLALNRRLSEALAQADAYANEAASLQTQIADLRKRDALSQIKIAALASMLKEAPQAMAVVAWDPAAQRGFVKTANMPAPRPDQDYQLWIIDPDYKQPVSAGVFEPGHVAIPAAARDLEGESVCGEPREKGGSSSTPQGPIVLAGD